MVYTNILYKCLWNYIGDGKGKLKGKQISHSHSHVSGRTNKAFKPNLQKVRLEDENGTVRTDYVCTKCLKKVN